MQNPCGAGFDAIWIDVQNRGASLQVLGTGASLPGAALSTAELLSRLNPSLTPAHSALARRLARRLGIHFRHLSRDLALAAEGVRSADAGPQLAARALMQALTRSPVAAPLDFLIGHTATPHTLLPSNAAWIADEIGHSGPHVELRQACTGFAAACTLALGLLASGCSRIGIAASETGSVYFDPRRIEEDPSQLVNLVQMGDGAGAIVLGPHIDAQASHIEHVYYGSAGLHRSPGLMLADGGSGSPHIAAGSVPLFAHRFEQIRDGGVQLLQQSVDAAREAGVELATVDWFLPHQANGRMAEICARHLNLPEQRIICEAADVGNLGSAAIWVALDRLRRSGKLNLGDRVLVCGAEATKYLYGGFLYVHGAT
jgi:3-oxoacyl-[acyl-carrier-protein] synthase III